MKADGGGEAKVYVIARPVGVQNLLLLKSGGVESRSTYSETFPECMGMQTVMIHDSDMANTTENIEG